MDYEGAGVNIKATDNVLRKFFNLKEFSATVSNLEGPLVLSCDGVGTKSKIAQSWQKYDTIGIDLVAMVVNDIITKGARPRYFLDYIGMERFDKDVFTQLLRGIIRGCEEAGCILVGGETAELPGVYARDPLSRLGFELVGFGVGFVDKPGLSSKLPEEGDILIGLPSSGFHANGYSLLRAVMFGDDETPALADYFDHDWSCLFGRDLGEVLLQPTRIYVDDISKILASAHVKAIAHITGGGLYGNIARVLPPGLSYELWEDSWEVHKEFRVIQQEGHISKEEMFNTFNMGIGMVLVIEGIYGPRFKHLQIGKVIKKEKNNVA